MNSKVVFVIFGPQGSGKSTQVERLAKTLNFAIFEAGTVLREMAKTDKLLHQQISNGVLVGDESMFEIVDKFVEDTAPSKGYVFDGYPRNIDQFAGFSTIASKYNWRVAGIFINLSDKSATSRLSQRFQLINGQKVVREDDSPEIVKKRLETFKRETLPLRESFREKFTLLEIDGEPGMDEVSQQISTAVGEFLHE
ncbi:MAG: nucleoside monophosphate kinase [Patescibacteria group bacterium]